MKRREPHEFTEAARGHSSKNWVANYSVAPHQTNGAAAARHRAFRAASGLGAAVGAALRAAPQSHKIVY